MAVKTRKVDLSGGKRITKAKQAEQERLAKELKAANTKRLFNEISAAEAKKKAATTKSPTKTTRPKSEAIRKEFPNFNVVSRDQQSRKVDKVTGNVRKEYPLTPGERKRIANYGKRVEKYK